METAPNRKQPLKLVLIWWVIAIILESMLISIFTYPLAPLHIKFLLILNSALLVIAITLYEIKVHLSLICLFLSEMIYVITAALNGNEAKANSDTFLGVCLLISAIIITSKRIKEQNKILKQEGGAEPTKKTLGIKLKDIIKYNIEPFKVKPIFLVLAGLAVITLIFSLTNVLRAEQRLITWQAVAFTIAPTMILLLSIFPIREVIYVRAIYYIFGICLIQMSYDVGGLSLISAIEPFVYLVTIIIGRIYASSVIKSDYDKGKKAKTREAETKEVEAKEPKAISEEKAKEAEGKPQ